MKFDSYIKLQKKSFIMKAASAAYLMIYGVFMVAMTICYHLGLVGVIAAAISLAAGFLITVSAAEEYESYQILMVCKDLTNIKITEE